MILFKQIQEKLKSAVEASGIREEELCRRLAISPKVFQGYINGSKKPKLDIFANLCAILNVDGNDILCIKEREQ